MPIVVTGFEPIDLLQGIFACIRQLEAGRAEVENTYSRMVRREGNPHRAGSAVDKCSRSARSAGAAWARSPTADWGSRRNMPRYDASIRFGGVATPPERPSECLAGEVLRGVLKPFDCPAFGTRCTPERPLGATMVSSEGACAAYYRYRGLARGGIDAAVGVPA